MSDDDGALRFSFAGPTLAPSTLITTGRVKTATDERRPDFVIVLHASGEPPALQWSSSSSSWGVARRAMNVPQFALTVRGRWALMYSLANQMFPCSSDVAAE